MTQPITPEFTLRDLFQVLSRRRAILLWSVAASLVVGLGACAIATRQYQATATVELQSSMADGLDRKSLMGGGQANADPLAADVDMQTQVKILQSNTLALRTIAELKLTDHFKAHSGGLWPFHTAAAIDEAHATAAALSSFRRNLAVKPITGTRLIEISYIDPSPDTAAAVVNDLIRQLTSFSVETSTEATDEAANALSKELEGLRRQSAELQKRVAGMQANTGMYDQGTTDAQGHEQAYSDILVQFQRASSVLSDATQNRILKSAIARVANSGNAELISSLAGNTAGGTASSSVTNSLGTIQSLRVSEGQMKTQLDQLQVKFGSGYAKVTELQAGIDGIERAIQDETERIKQRAQSDSAVADMTFNEAQQNYDRLKEKADTLNNRTIDYRLTKQEADESRTLYSDLLNRLKEAGVLQGLQTNTVTVVDTARVPRTPARPTVPLYLAAAAVLGVLIGFFGIALMELLDDTITDFAIVSGMGLRLAGILPKPARNTRKAIGQTGYRDAVRTNFTQLMRSNHAVGPVKHATMIVVTPVGPEGSAAPFAASMAASAHDAGNSVLLVHAATAPASDPHTEVDHLVYAGDSYTTYKFESAEPEMLLTPSNVQRLLQEWRTLFDLIVVEAPSALFLPDAAMLSEMADVTVQLVQYGVTTKTSLRRASGMLKESAAARLAVALEDVPVNSNCYRNYYGANGRNWFKQRKAA